MTRPPRRRALVARRRMPSSGRHTRAALASLVGTHHATPDDDDAAIAKSRVRGRDGERVRAAAEALSPCWRRPASGGDSAAGRFIRRRPSAGAHSRGVERGGSVLFPRGVCRWRSRGGDRVGVGGRRRARWTAASGDSRPGADFGADGKLGGHAPRRGRGEAAVAAVRRAAVVADARIRRGCRRESHHDVRGGGGDGRARGDVADDGTARDGALTARRRGKIIDARVASLGGVVVPSERITRAGRAIADAAR